MSQEPIHEKSIEPVPSSQPADASSPNKRPTHWNGTNGLLVIGLLVFVGIVVLAWRLQQAPTPPVLQDPASRHKPTPVPPLSSSPFKNTIADASYVGSDVCTKCHEGRAGTFRQTGMGRSMAKVDIDHQPPDGSFRHEKSQTLFQVDRKDDKLWHRELAEPGAKLISEYPMKYVIGSGRHAHTYIAEADGFLVESPITWYESRKCWDMSPGYDHRHHQGFRREVGENCLVCHAGRVEVVDHGARTIIHEAAISCERCHGPGSLHVGLHSKGANEKSVDGIDYTIVNPSHLPRERAEAVCQQCHLQSAATVLGRGRGIQDFRPGLPLQDFRQDYRLEIDDKPMTVVGHVEQMQRSRCYTKSDSLTCTTCHSPHASVAKENSVVHYRNICRSCHQSEHCGVDPKRRQRESPSNNCIQCHMPTSPTDVPHVSFTHHQIAIHEKTAGSQEPSKTESHDPGPGELKLLLDYPNLGPLDRKRSLGLAYLRIAESPDAVPHGKEYRRKGELLLDEVHGAGLTDGVVASQLARLRFEQDSPKAMELAEEALALELSDLERCRALFVVAAEQFKRKQFSRARAGFRELTDLRRHHDDWILLAECEKALGNRAGYTHAINMAIRIHPRLVRKR